MLIMVELFNSMSAVPNTRNPSSQCRTNNASANTWLFYTDVCSLSFDATGIRRPLALFISPLLDCLLTIPYCQSPWKPYVWRHEKIMLHCLSPQGYFHVEKTLSFTVFLKWHDNSLCPQIHSKFVFKTIQKVAERCVEIVFVPIGWAGGGGGGGGVR